MSENMQQSDDGRSWVPAEPIPEPWTWKYVRRLRRLFRRKPGQSGEGGDDG